MIHETIDTNEVIKLFRQLLQMNSVAQILFLVGEAKLGKSHLLTKVFPTLAQQEHQACYAVIDLRDSTCTIPDILSLASSQLDRKHFTHYQGAYQTWISQPRVRMEHIFLFLSSLTLSAKQEHEDMYKNEIHLTTQFIKDIEIYNDKLLLLLIDHIDNAAEKIQAWLMNTFLVELSLLKHIRVIVAGRSIKEPHGKYAPFCLHHQLHAVTEEEAYVTYCQRINVALSEQSVRDIARLLDYRPGMFVDYVLPKFWQSR